MGLALSLVGAILITALACYYYPTSTIVMTAVSTSLPPGSPQLTGNSGPGVFQTTVNEVE